MEDLAADGKPLKPSPFNNLFLARAWYTGLNKWWLYVISFLLSFLLGYLLVGNIIAIPFLASAINNGITVQEILHDQSILFNADKIGMDRNLHLALTMCMFVFWLLFFGLCIKYLQKKNLLSVISGYDKLRWKRYFTAFGTWAALTILYSVLTYFLYPSNYSFQFEPGRFVILVIVSVVFFPIQTATEEIIFRGYLLQGFGLAFKRAWPGLIITSVLFGLMHGMNPETKTHGFLVMMPFYMLFGLFLGFLTLLDEGLELAMGIHCANNLCSCLIVTSDTTVLKTDAILLEQAQYPLFQFVSWMVMAAICFALLYRKYKWKNWRIALQ